MILNVLICLSKVSQMYFSQISCYLYNLSLSQLIQYMNRQFFNISAEDSNTLAKMKEWLYLSGAKYDHLEVVNFDKGDYRGVISTKPIQKKERIIFIPKNRLITLEMAKNCTFSKEIIDKNIQLFSPKHTFLSLFLLEELSKGQKSEWRYYIDILPKDHSCFPINYTNQQLSELIGTGFLIQIHEKVLDIKRDYDLIASKIQGFRKFKFRDFCWARVLVGSRMFGLFIDGVKTDILAPFADMLNHRIPKQTSWNYDQNLNGFTIESLKDIKEGQQIFDSYGKKCNSRYLLNYGFVMENNPENQVCIQCSLRDNEVLPKKLEMMKKQQNEFKVLKISVHMNDTNFFQSMAYLRFRNIQNSNQLNILEKISGIKLTKEPYLAIRTPPMSIELEMQVWTDLKILCLKKLSEFKTTIQADEEMLSKQLTQNIKNIVILRLGEKKVYKFYVQICEDIIDLLSQGYVKSIEILAKSQDKIWFHYMQKILSIMPNEKSKEMRGALMEIAQKIKKNEEVEQSVSQQDEQEID